MKTPETEKDEAIRMANKALDVPNADPDDDLRTVSRQFLRALERENGLRDDVEYLKGVIKQTERDAAREIDKYRDA